MKILHVYKTYYPETLGGIESFIDTLSASLKNQGIESGIITTTRQKEIRVSELRHSQSIFYYPASITFSSCPISISFLKNFKKIAESYDILHYHFPWPFTDLTHLLCRIKKPSVITYHSDIVKQKFLNFFYSPLMHQFLKKVNAIVATSPNYLKTSLVLKCYQQKIEIIPFGIDHNQLPTPTEEKLADWKNKVGENFVLFVGVLRYYKGLEFLLDAVANTTIPLVIAGTGPEEEKLRRIAKEKKLNNVIFVGYVDDSAKTALYQLCKAVVAPAHLRSEAFCFALLEGLLFRKPLISTEIGTGTSFVNKNDFTGMVVPPENPMALRRAMERLLSDNDYYQQLKNNITTYYENNFTTTIMTQKYSALYKRIMR